ncbi:MAG: hypothetical protein WBA09_19675, partial [Candidatus Acidiferrum sp.]
MVTRTLPNQSATAPAAAISLFHDPLFCLGSHPPSASTSSRKGVVISSVLGLNHSVRRWLVIRRTPP